MTKKKNIIIITLSIVLVLLAAAIILYFCLSNWMWYSRGFEEKINIDQAHVVFGDESFLIKQEYLDDNNYVYEDSSISFNKRSKTIRHQEVVGYDSGASSYACSYNANLTLSENMKLEKMYFKYSVKQVSDVSECISKEYKDYDYYYKNSGNHVLCYIRRHNHELSMRLVMNNSMPSIMSDEDHIAVNNYIYEIIDNLI